MPSAKHKTTQKHKEGKERGLMDFRLLPVEQQHLWIVTKEERCKKKRNKRNWVKVFSYSERERESQSHQHELGFRRALWQRNTQGHRLQPTPFFMTIMMMTIMVIATEKPRQWNPSPRLLKEADDKALPSSCSARSLYPRRRRCRSIDFYSVCLRSCWWPSDHSSRFIQLRWFLDRSRTVLQPLLFCHHPKWPLISRSRMSSNRSTASTLKIIGH